MWAQQWDGSESWLDKLDSWNVGDALWKHKEHFDSLDDEYKKMIESMGVSKKRLLKYKFKKLETKLSSDTRDRTDTVKNEIVDAIRWKIDEVHNLDENNLKVHSKELLDELKDEMKEQAWWMIQKALIATAKTLPFIWEGLARSIKDGSATAPALIMWGIWALLSWAAFGWAAMTAWWAAWWWALILYWISKYFKIDFKDLLPDSFSNWWKWDTDDNSEWWSSNEWWDYTPEHLGWRPWWTPAPATDSNEWDSREETEGDEDKEVKEVLSPRDKLFWVWMAIILHTSLIDFKNGRKKFETTVPIRELKETWKTISEISGVYTNFKGRASLNGLRDELGIKDSKISEENLMTLLRAIVDKNHSGVIMQHQLQEKKLKHMLFWDSSHVREYLIEKNIVTKQEAMKIRSDGFDITKLTLEQLGVFMSLSLPMWEAISDFTGAFKESLYWQVQDIDWIKDILKEKQETILSKNIISQFGALGWTDGGSDEYMDLDLVALTSKFKWLSPVEKVQLEKLVSFKEKLMREFSKYSFDMSPVNMNYAKIIPLFSLLWWDLDWGKNTDAIIRLWVYQTFDTADKSSFMLKLSWYLYEQWDKSEEEKVMYEILFQKVISMFESGYTKPFDATVWAAHRAAADTIGTPLTIASEVWGYYLLRKIWKRLKLPLPLKLWVYSASAYLASALLLKWLDKIVKSQLSSPQQEQLFGLVNMEIVSKLNIKNKTWWTVSSLLEAKEKWDITDKEIQTALNYISDEQDWGIEYTQTLSNNTEFKINIDKQSRDIIISIWWVRYKFENYPKWMIVKSNSGEVKSIQIHWVSWSEYINGNWTLEDKVFGVLEQASSGINGTAQVSIAEIIRQVQEFWDNNVIMVNSTFISWPLTLTWELLNKIKLVKIN